LPEPPEDHESKVTSFLHLAANGNAHHLAMHLGNLDTTLVGGERYVVTRTTRNMAGSHYPDLLVAFDVNLAAYHARNGYIMLGRFAVKSTAKCPRATVATQRRPELNQEICRPSPESAAAGAPRGDGTFESRARRAPAALSILNSEPLPHVRH